MSWIRMAVVGLAVCATASVASAQGAPSGTPQTPAPGAQQGGPGRGMQSAFEGITLTETQQTQIQAIRDKYRAEMQALFPNGRPSSLDDATKAKLSDIRAKQGEEIRAVLTAEQQTVYDKNLAEAKKRMDEMQKKNQ